MIPRNQEHFLFFLALVAMLALSLCDGRPACAQEVTDTAPFEMQHPETKEPGAWIPRWLQSEHLQTENDLETCAKKSAKQDQVLNVRQVELEQRQAALEESKKAEKTLQEALAYSQVQLEEEKQASEAKGDWLLVTTTVSIIATGIAVALAAL